MIKPKAGPVYFGPEIGQFHVWEDDRNVICVAAGVVVTLGTSPALVLDVDPTWTGHKKGRSGWAWIAVTATGYAVTPTSVVCGAGTSVPSDSVDLSDGLVFHIPIARWNNGPIQQLLGGKTGLAWVPPQNVTIVP